jgi:uncharacterized protein involved in exopolysaccharide biosynthesis
MVSPTDPELLPHLGGHGAVPPGSLPQVEVVTGPSGPIRPAEPEVPWHQAWRLRIFVLVFLAILLPGAAWDFLRPARYRAVATVLTVAPTGVGKGLAGETADLQHVAVQDHVLLGRDLLEDTLARAREGTDLGALDADTLRPILAVTPQPDTNLVELSATGGEPPQLAAIVNAWIAGYQAMRQRQVAEDVGEALTKLNDEHARLTSTLETKRAALDRFRDDNDIVTMERDGNTALARLKSLTTELNKVRDQQVEARARLDALVAAIAKGEPVVPDAEQGSLTELEKQAAQLRAQVTELNKRYTPVFIENEPNARIIPAQLKEIESKIAEKLAKGQRVVQVQAEQEVAQARSRVRVLEEQLQEDKRAAAEFTRRFGQYEAMKVDLEELEVLNRETEGRLVGIQAKGQEKYPQVDVIEPAHPPATPFEPDYWGDLLWVLVGAGGAALAAVLLLEFLAPRRREEPEPAPVTGVRIFAGAPPVPGNAGLNTPSEGPPALQPSPANPGLAAPPAGLLPGTLPRELSITEVAALWALATPVQRQLMALLLAGLTLEECAGLAEADFDLVAGTLRVPGPAPRLLDLDAGVRDLLVAHQPLPLWRDLGVDEPAARIGLIASDAGLAQPHEIDAAALRHTYIAFLVRQGGRLSQIEHLVGPMPTADLLRYARLSPAGPARPLKALRRGYPLPEHQSKTW